MKKKVLMLVLACSFLLTACNPLSADVEDGQVQTEENFQKIPQKVL